MGPLHELLASGHRQVLEFFAVGLRDVSEIPVDRQELLYNASVLAHYAQTSTGTREGWPTPATLVHVFDQFVLHPMPEDCEMLEAAGAECLLLAGFFEDQMRRRHNIRWYSQLGAGFFTRAAQRSPSPEKARFLLAMGERFEPWRRRHARLARELRDQAYLLLPRAS
jgi:hypothetical protein